MKKNIQSTRTLARAILAPLIKYCADRRGAMAEVVKLYNKGLLQPVPMTTIRRWLLLDETKWIEPQGGSLLHLLNIWRGLRGQDVEGVRDQTIECAACGCEPSRNGEHCKRCGREFRLPSQAN